MLNWIIGSIIFIAKFYLTYLIGYLILVSILSVLCYILKESMKKQIEKLIERFAKLEEIENDIDEYEANLKENIVELYLKSCKLKYKKKLKK